MNETPSAENDALRELVEAGMTYAEAEAALCDHPSKVWLDDETGWRCYDCNFVIGHQECTDHDAQSSRGELVIAVIHWMFTDAYALSPLAILGVGGVGWVLRGLRDRRCDIPPATTEGER